MKDKKTFIPDILEALNRLWNNGDVSHVEDLVTADFVRREPLDNIINGPQELARLVLDLRTQYPDMVVTFEENVFDGETMFINWRFRGTDRVQHPRSEIPPSGNKVDFKGVDMLRFAEDKIAEDAVYYDELQVLQQLGHIPATM